MNEKNARTILIVEDDDDIGNFIVLALHEETPYEPVLVTDSFQALGWVKTHIPNLFILDYHLPGMNGLALYDLLQARKELKDVPVIMISANVPENEVKKCDMLLVRKPFELEELLEMIDLLIDQPVSIARYVAEKAKQA